MKDLRNYSNDFFGRIAIDCCSLIDKKCLSTAFTRFLESGKKEDAFDVYFCFAEIFKIFGEGYDKNTKHLLELICDYEMNAGALVESQRDHYSHSVFVFAMGLAVYAKSVKFQKLFKEKTSGITRSTDEEFLYRWGLTALFHDIGYPFEIVFEQIKAYVTEINRDKTYCPLLTYKNLESFYSCNGENINTELAKEIGRRLNMDCGVLTKEISTLIEQSDEYIDHGYFGAVIMFKNLMQQNNKSIALDVASSIMLHNSFLVWKVRKHFDRKVSPNDHPLAFLLMLCDDLQDFGREGFGKVNKKDNLAYTAEFNICENEFCINYIFDEKGSGKATVRRDAKREKISFYDYESIFDKIRIDCEIRKNPKPAGFYMSASFFRNIQKIAMQIHSNYIDADRRNKLSEEWDKLTLEYKLSNIAQAKSYAEKLAKYGYFYDDRNLNYKTVEAFSDKQIESLASDEHKRWLQEKKVMGWKYGEPKNKAEREQLRIHPCIVPYNSLSDDDREKDKDTVRHLIENLNKAGFQVYKFR